VFLFLLISVGKPMQNSRNTTLKAENRTCGAKKWNVYSTKRTLRSITRDRDCRIPGQRGGRSAIKIVRPMSLPDTSIRPGCFVFSQLTQEPIHGFPLSLNSTACWFWVSERDCGMCWSCRQKQNRLIRERSYGQRGFVSGDEDSVRHPHISRLRERAARGRFRR
jgi:hypothetical protein